MTLKEAEKDERFEQFKFCDFMKLNQYILKCQIFLDKKEDAEVREFYDAAKLIRDSRLGK